jgi:hypothetical protein
MGAGNSEDAGPCAENVHRAVNWLMGVQKPDGSIFSKIWGYEHPMASMALAEAAIMSRKPETIESVRRALRACERAQSPAGGWHYEPGAKTTDLSVSSWHVQFLYLAQWPEFNLDQAVLQMVRKYVASCHCSTEGYSYGPGGGQKPSTTAMGALATYLLNPNAINQNVDIDYMLQKGGVPTWATPPNDPNHRDCYAHYGTRLMYAIGGKRWQQWNTAMTTAYLANQTREGDNAGSWTGGSEKGPMGRVGQTALTALCLEVYYRFPRRFVTVGK